ncbi:MAG TPA: AlkA N-terminal domain-containing protein, partial [Acidimicrobiales bacterium]|nr:AlkA N-terminal domain-containing protein [Acidimicrobiales bacterium]
PEWNVRADVVARAMRLIRDGVVDLEGVEGLARRLGYSTRQLNRLITAEVGTGPLALARAQRSQTARLLLETTELPIAHIAFAAGFASVRQCNDTIREIFADTPSGLRARAAKSSQAKRDRQLAAPQAIHLRLPCRRPFNPASVLDFLGLRALPGVEALESTSYRRTLRLPHGHAVVTLAAPVPGRDETDGPAYIGADLVLSDLRDLTTAVARCRQLLDLDADPIAVCEALRYEPLIGELVAKDPGRRVPGAAEGFELAVRAVIGQQVSVAGARTVAGRLVEAAGDALSDPTGPLTHLFPTPEALAELATSDPGAFAMPTSRRRALVALAEAVADGGVVIDPGADPVELRRSLVALPGIGSWTAEYVAMRALRDPDAFMPTDLGIRRGAQALGLPDGPAQLLAVSEGWRPWRSYAMAHLWALPIPTAEIPARPQKGRAA